MHRRAVKIGAVVLGSYAALMAVTRLAYRTVLYPAPNSGLERAPRGAEIRPFTATDGEPVQAVIYGEPSDPAVVFFHGNGETVADSVDLAMHVAGQGLRFVAVEYRGYGGSPASDPSEQGLYADAAGVLDALIAEGTPVDRITAWGNSLGSGVALEMVVRGKASRLILQAPYTSIPDVARTVAPFLPMRWLIADRFDNAAKAHAVQVPTLILHGTADRVVPYAMGQALAGAIDGAKLVTVPDAGHNELFAIAWDALMPEVVAWAKLLSAVRAAKGQHAAGLGRRIRRGKLDDELLDLRAAAADHTFGAGLGEAAFECQNEEIDPPERAHHEGVAPTAEDTVH